MINDKVLAKHLLNAVWEEDVEMVDVAISAGGDPSWIFNGYPLLFHAVFTRNWEIVQHLIDAGATQVGEALGFALDRGIGEMVMPLAFLGVIPKAAEVKKEFGPYPSRYCPLGYTPPRHRKGMS